MSYVLAIAGITGNLGQAIAPVILDKNSKFSRVIALVRDPSTSAAQSVAAKGAELVKVAEDASVDTVAKALQGVDVLFNVLGSAAAAYKGTLGEAAVKAGVKVYFLSEFGIDHHLGIPFPGYEHVEWTHKHELDKKIRQSAGKTTKVIAVYNSLFLEDALGPWFGFDTAGKTYTAVGSTSQPLSFTSKADVGRALVALALRALADPSSVPDFVRIAGSTYSYEQIARIVEKYRRANTGDDSFSINVVSDDLQAFVAKTKEAFKADPSQPPLGHLRIAFGEGNADFSSTNSNEIFNPGQSVFKWKTLDDYVKEVKGAPFGF